MSGAVVELVSKGAQDVYLTNNDGGSSFFKLRYTRHTNFAQVAKRMDFTGQVQNSGATSVFIRSVGDLVNNMWLEGTNIVGNLSGTTFELYIGGKLIDSQTFDYMADIWQIYMAETYSKCQTINNNMSQSNKNFFPLHFFFCDNQMFLPLLNLQYHQVEIRINWGSSIQNVSNLKVYGNFIFLDTKEREEMVSKPMELLITQVQRILSSSTTSIDLAYLNHPVKSIFFGYPQNSDPNEFWTFEEASMFLNGTELFENMSPSYFHTIQGYYGTQYGLLNFSTINLSPVYTQYYMYNFCIDATSYKPTGTCNFSRLDNAKLTLKNPVFASQTPPSSVIVYAVNYNILKIKDGLSGILFSN